MPWMQWRWITRERAESVRRHVRQPSTEPWIRASFIWAPRAAVCAVILGLAVLAGYAFGFEPLWRPVPDGPATHPMTAVTVILIGLSALLARPRRPSNVSALLAVLAGSIAAARLVTIALGRDDVFQLWSPFSHTLSVADLNGERISMGLRASVMIVLLAVALCLIWARRPFASQIFVILAAYPPIFTMIGYAYGIVDLRGVLSLTTLTAGLLCIAAVLGRTTHRAPLRSLLAADSSGQIFRFQLFVLVGICFILGLIATRSGFEVPAKILSVGAAIIVLAIILVLANAAHRSQQLERLRSHKRKPAARSPLLLELERAAELGQMFLLYQPQVNLAAGRPIGAEVLMRWRHPIRGLISPTEFIPLAESSGLIHGLGLWALEEACGQAARWRSGAMSKAKIAVNVSPIQLRQPGFADAVRQIALGAGLNLNRLILEITESAMVPSNGDGLLVLAQLRESGVRIAIDDFGTGYSSLSYLRDLPSDDLKIDQSFVRDVPGDPRAEAIARAIVAVGKSLGHQILAEGIETREQAEFLKSIGCDKGQGFLFAHPMRADELEAWAEAASVIDSGPTR